MTYTIFIIVGCVFLLILFKPKSGFMADKRHRIRLGVHYIKESLKKGRRGSPVEIEFIPDDVFRELAERAYTTVEGEKRHAEKDTFLNDFYECLNYGADAIYNIISGNGNGLGEKVVTDLFRKYGVRLPQAAIEDQNTRYAQTANEIAVFIQTINEAGRGRLLFDAQSFRQEAPVEKILLSPGDFSPADCATHYQMIANTHARAVEQSQRILAQFAEMGMPKVKCGEYAHDLDFKRRAMRLWMATLAARIQPECTEQVRKAWLLLTGVSDDIIEQIAQSERMGRSVSSAMDVPTDIAQLQRVIREIRIAPKL